MHFFFFFFLSETLRFKRLPRSCRASFKTLDYIYIAIFKMQRLPRTLI